MLNIINEYAALVTKKSMSNNRFTIPIVLYYNHKTNMRDNHFTIPIVLYYNRKTNMRGCFTTPDAEFFYIQPYA